MKHLLFLFLSIIFISYFTACSGGSSSSSDTSNDETTENTSIDNDSDTDVEETLSSSVQFKGLLSSELSLSPARKSFGGIGGIGRIVGIAFDNLDNVITAPISSDGSFSIDLERDKDWILLTANTDATNKEDVIGNYISISEGNNRLTSIPIGSNTKDIDVGTLSAAGDETTSSNSIDDLEADLGLSSDNLLQLAVVDGLAKFVKNHYLNNDPDSDIVFESRIWYDFDDINILYDNYGDVNSYTFNLIRADIHSNHPSFASDSDSNLTVEYPTDPVTIGASWRGENLYFNPSDYVRLAGITDSIPEGYFKVKDDNETIAVFDLAVSSVFDAQGKFTGIYPSVKLATNASNQVEGVYIKMYGYNQTTNSYDQITDINIIKKYASLAWADFGTQEGSMPPYSYDLHFDTSTANEFLSGSSDPLPFSNGEFHLTFPGGPFDTNSSIGLGITMNLVGNVMMVHEFTFVSE